MSELIANLPQSYLPNQDDLDLQEVSYTMRKNQTPVVPSKDQQLILPHVDSMLSLESLTDRGVKLPAASKPRDMNVAVNSNSKQSSPLGTSQTRRQTIGRQSLQEVKLATMQMRRRVPQLYFSPSARDSTTNNLNSFNKVLKESLLLPQKHREVTTKRE